MEVLFIFCPADDPRLLQQIVVDLDMLHLKLTIDRYVQELAEARAVVIPYGLGVAKCFKDGIAETQNVINVLINRFFLLLVEVMLQKPKTLLVGLCLPSP